MKIKNQKNEKNEIVPAQFTVMPVQTEHKAFIRTTKYKALFLVSLNGSSTVIKDANYQLSGNSIPVIKTQQNPKKKAIKTLGINFKTLHHKRLKALRINAYVPNNRAAKEFEGVSALKFLIYSYVFDNLEFITARLLHPILGGFKILTSIGLTGTITKDQLALSLKRLKRTFRGKKGRGNSLYAYFLLNQQLTAFHTLKKYFFVKPLDLEYETVTAARTSYRYFSPIEPALINVSFQALTRQDYRVLKEKTKNKNKNIVCNDQKLNKD